MIDLYILKCYKCYSSAFSRPPHFLCSNRVEANIWAMISIVTNLLPEAISLVGLMDRPAMGMKVISEREEATP